MIYCQVFKNDFPGNIFIIAVIVNILTMTILIIIFLLIRLNVRHQLSDDKDITIP